MAVFLAYFSVVLVWATTPLAIQWSGDSISFVAAVLARMLCALCLAFCIAIICRKSFQPFLRHAKIHFAASIGIFPNMIVVYWAAQFISSGLVAVIFALSPFATGLMTLILLKQNPFTLRRLGALLLAVLGLCIIFYHQMQFKPHSMYGIVGILLSCLFFSFSTVWVKKISLTTEVNVGVFYQATGAMLFSMPGLLISWWWLDGVVPQSISVKSASAILYLAVIGSLVGMALFFYILQRLSATLVSLVTLMTPVLAILIGKNLANEELSSQTLVGVSVVLFALILYLPLSFQSVFRKLKICFFKLLRASALSDTENPEAALQKLKDDYLRYK